MILTVIKRIAITTVLGAPLFALGGCVHHHGHDHHDRVVVVDRHHHRGYRHDGYRGGYHGRHDGYRGGHRGR